MVLLHICKEHWGDCCASFESYLPETKTGLNLKFEIETSQNEVKAPKNYREHLFLTRLGCSLGTEETESHLTLVQSEDKWTFSLLLEDFSGSGVSYLRARLCCNIE